MAAQFFVAMITALTLTAELRGALRLGRNRVHNV